MQAAGYDTPPDIVPKPETEVTADFEVIDGVVTDDPQRHHDLRTARAERSVVLGVDQNAER